MSMGRKIVLTAIAWVALFLALDVVILHRQGLIEIVLSHPKFAIALLSGLGLLVAYSVAAFVRLFWQAPEQVSSEENAIRANQIQFISTVVQALGGIAVLIGIYFA